MAGSFASPRWELMRKGRGGTHSKRFKNLVAVRRRFEDINNLMANEPQTMSELCSHFHEELEIRLEEAERVGYSIFPTLLGRQMSRMSAPEWCSRICSVKCCPLLAKQA